MVNDTSIGLSFFGLSPKELAVFDRVIEFIAKKGKKFHKCATDNADILIVNDDQSSISSAQTQQGSRILITVSDGDDCSVGDYKIKRPLLVTRVMRAMDESSKLCRQSVPAENTPAIRQSTSLSTHTEATRSEAARFHALVVDDSAAIRKQLEIELRGTDIGADYADCGEVALEKIAKKQYDLIFLDIIMPGLNGYEVCKQLRQMPHYKRTPVIMLSGKTEPLDEVEGIIAGASTYLLKPVKHHDFQKTLGRISKWLSQYA